MKMTNSTAMRILSSLRHIDKDAGVKLSGQVRLDLARNINRLFPDVAAFESAAAGKGRELQRADGNSETNGAIMAEIDALGNTEIEVKLFKIDPAALKLDDNPRITGDMIASLAPILKDFDTLDGE